MCVSLRYSIVLHKSKEGYAVSCPALPGCWSQGRLKNRQWKICAMQFVSI